MIYSIKLSPTNVSFTLFICCSQAHPENYFSFLINSHSSFGSRSILLQITVLFLKNLLLNYFLYYHSVSSLHILISLRPTT